jgi:hypothetical protein
MPVKAGYSTPLLQVEDVQRSLRFYALLGFETVDMQTGRNGRVGWARAECSGGALMFVPHEEPPKETRDRFLLYLYTPDLTGLCEQLRAAGIDPGPISRSEYMRSGEICLRDPDGFVVLIGHWGAAEDEAWKSQLAEKRAGGALS